MEFAAAEGNYRSTLLAAFDRHELVEFGDHHHPIHHRRLRLLIAILSRRLNLMQEHVLCKSQAQQIEPVIDATPISLMVENFFTLKW